MKRASFLLAALMSVVAVTPSASAIEQLQYSSVQSRYAEQYVVKTDVEDIVQDINGNYAIVTTNDKYGTQTFVPVGRQDFLLTSEDSLEMLQNLEGIEEETKNTIIQMAQDIKVNGSCDCDECSTVSVYSPDLLPTTRGSSTDYDWYDGHRMKIEILTRDAHAGFVSIAKGAPLENTAMAIKGIVFDKALEYIGAPLDMIFGPGVTLLDAIYKDFNGIEIYGESKDDIQLQIEYTNMVKHTYAERTPGAEDWAVGCLSYAANITDCEFDYEFYKNDTRVFSGDVNTGNLGTLYSEHYGDNNLRTAWLNIGHPYADDPIRVKVGNVNFNLV